MGGNFCQKLELGGGTTIKGRRVLGLIHRTTEADWKSYSILIGL